MNFEKIEKIYDDSLHSFIFSQKSKPLDAIENVLQHFIPFSLPLSLSTGEIFPLGLEKEALRIVLLQEGICSFCHQKSQRQIGVVFAPSLLGLTDSYARSYNVSEWPQHYIVAETECTGYSILVSDFIKVADEQGLWHDIARILVQRLMAMSAREEEMIGVDSYLKVRTLLIEVWAYPENYRKQINILNFVQRRTNLSKSRIMKILSELKKGSYINIDSGKLIDLKKLPLAY
ncbi:cytoplasmic protein [Superficieibacter electus]|uniref:Cytoplasmic protein n=1 Tax=Superficieibacter electus TaxID=2022662 RepID=A0A2P5GJ94_9ENTR|nr:winged helix-turn-helix transcriptional regulator [Superficieibacter electus]POP41355.1 cytoplasmic protein [Superficieibacter electus]POP43747.1 cytoplasmic protein [Superficieibacter electus]